MVSDPLTLNNFNIAKKKMQTKTKTRCFFIPVRLTEPFQELTMLEIIGTEQHNDLHTVKSNQW